MREDNRACNTTFIFSYDQCGNITERCEYDYTLKSGEELAELDCTHYSYDYAGDKLVNYNGEAFAYNNLGNPTTYRNNAVEWQYGKRLVKLGETTFAYDGLGRRTKKGDITFVYDSDGRLMKQSDGLEFVYDNAGVIGFKYSDAQYFYRRDVQGNIIAILDSNGNVVVKYVYDAWGNNVALDANGAQVVDGIGVLNPFRYRGYYYDTETELYYLQARYYDPELGRFISQDSLEYADPETINGLNLYAYCGNNPVMNVDPTGEFSLLVGLLILFGACVVVGSTAGGISAAKNGENVWEGIGKGALVGLMFGVSAVVATIGVVTPLSHTPVGSIMVGAGVGSAFSLGVNLYSQLKNGGIGGLDLKSAAKSWGIGLGVGSIAGVLGYGGTVVGKFLGELIGLNLSEGIFLGMKISKIISGDFLAELGSLIGGALGGFIAGKIVNYSATSSGLQSKNIPLWLTTIIKFFGRK